MPIREPQTRVHQNEGLAGEDPHRLRQEPESRVVVVTEEGANRHEGQHHRRQHEDEQIAAQRELLREQEGKEEADHHLQRHGHDDEDDRVVQPVPNVGVGENLGVVVEPDPGRRPRPVGLVAEEGQPERPQKREDVHQKKERERRRHEEAADVFSPRVCDQRHGEKGGERGRSPEGNLRRQECNRQRHADHENDQRALPIVPAQRDDTLEERNSLGNVSCRCHWLVGSRRRWFRMRNGRPQHSHGRAARRTRRRAVFLSGPRPT